MPSVAVLYITVIIIYYVNFKNCKLLYGVIILMLTLTIKIKINCIVLNDIILETFFEICTSQHNTEKRSAGQRSTMQHYAAQHTVQHITLKLYIIP